MRKNRYFDPRAAACDLQITAPPGRDLQIAVPQAHFESKYLLAHYQNIHKLEQNLQRLPSPEEFFFLQTGSAFNAFSFIPLVCKSESVRRLYASTYSISRKVIDALQELHAKGLVEEITLLISDSMIKRNPMTIDVLNSVAAANGNWKVLFGWNHSKVCLLETATGHYVIEGSGNWSENAAIEQYTFANSKGLFHFRLDLFCPKNAKQVAEGGGIKTINK